MYVVMCFFFHSGRVDKKRDKMERQILDSQERAFWNVHRPPVRDQYSDSFSLHDIGIFSKKFMPNKDKPPVQINFCATFWKFTKRVCQTRWKRFLYSVGDTTCVVP